VRKITILRSSHPFSATFLHSFSYLQRQTLCFWIYASVVHARLSRRLLHFYPICQERFLVKWKFLANADGWFSQFVVECAPSGYTVQVYVSNRSEEQKYLFSDESAGVIPRIFFVKTKECRAVSRGALRKTCCEALQDDERHDSLFREILYTEARASGRISNIFPIWSIASQACRACCSLTFPSPEYANTYHVELLRNSEREGDEDRSVSKACQ